MSPTPARRGQASRVGNSVPRRELRIRQAELSAMKTPRAGLWWGTTSREPTQMLPGAVGARLSPRASRNPSGGRSQASEQEGAANTLPKPRPRQKGDDRFSSGHQVSWLSHEHRKASPHGCSSRPSQHRPAGLRAWASRWGGRQPCPTPVQLLPMELGNGMGLSFAGRGFLLKAVGFSTIQGRVPQEAILEVPTGWNVGLPAVNPNQCPGPVPGRPPQCGAVAGSRAGSPSSCQSSVPSAAHRGREGKHLEPARGTCSRQPAQPRGKGTSAAATQPGPSQLGRDPRETQGPWLPQSHD